jgi:transcriptional regulator with XRE-family HTH domain
MGNSLPLWSSILHDIIKSPYERQRLISALGVADMTLTRWANGESHPHSSHLIRLLQVVQAPHRQPLLEALELQFPDIRSHLRDEASEQISPHFFAEVIDVLTTTAENQRFWRITDMVLRQALVQLDPHRLGMSIQVIQCVPPGEDKKIHSIRTTAGRGTSPWTGDLEHDILFLGLESLSGYTVEVRRTTYEPDLSKQGTIPVVRDEYEVSAAAHPIRYEGRIAGCLLASSRQIDHFSQQRLALLTTFSDLIALALGNADFYPIDQIDLRLMPSPKKQRPVIATFRQRVTKKIQDAASCSKHLGTADAEYQTWKEIEQELLEIAQHEPSDSYFSES